MIRKQKNQRHLTAFLLLAYLIVGLGVSNALLLCKESETFSHVEFNPAGQCQSSCLPPTINQNNPEWPSPSSFSGQTFADCQDSQVSLFHAPASRAQSIPLAPSTLGELVVQVSSNQHPNTAKLVRLSLAAQPPPSQTLLSLRTIVLLI